MAIKLRIGDPIPLATRLPDRDETKFVRARLFNASNVELVGSPVSLTHLSTGAYRNHSLPYPNSAFVDAIFDVFEDALFTTLVERYLPQIETFTLDTTEEAINSLLVNMMPDINARILNEDVLQIKIEDNEPLKAQLQSTDALTARLVSNEEAAAVTIPDIIEASERLLKSHRSAQAGTVAAFKAWAFTDSGDVVLADANTLTLSDFAGINMASIALGNFGEFAKQGNVSGAIATLGALPGQYVYLSGVAGELTLTSPVGAGDVSFIVGRAEPADGVTGAAVDLYIEPQEQG